MTQRKLAKKVGVSYPTLSTTLNMLEGTQIIKKGTGKIMLHPKVVMKDDARKEQSLMVKFEDFNTEKE
jgi:DNA-binding transcriptional regulator YhcF (GntR family)